MENKAKENILIFLFYFKKVAKLFKTNLKENFMMLSISTIVLTESIIKFYRPIGS